MKHNITVKEYIRNKALGLLGLIDSAVDFRVRDERLTFVNDIDEVQSNKLKEYNVWYEGDSDSLLNFYTRATTIDYNTDPLYNRNKKSYFWAVSATESDVKRTHSGQPRNITDTLSSIVGAPRIVVGDGKGALEPVNKRLKTILEDNNFDDVLESRSRPMTLVEGWGAWKINYDSSFRDTPILLYYRADSVDFVYRSNQLVAIIYRDYYQDEKKQNYILFETRRLDKKDGVPCLIIEKDLFRINGNSPVLTHCKLKDLPQLKDVAEKLVLDNFNRFLGQPSIFYEDSTGDCYGRSIFTGKIDLFDDLDQCLSQSSNAVRRSTATEVWDTNYLEKDRHTGMPVMPHSYDRKYVAFRGLRTGDGSVGTAPVQTMQPNINFSQYSAEEQNILLHIVDGIMSPATLGIDIAKKDNAEAEREKEKITIFTRNLLIRREGSMIRLLCNDLLCADELMRTGTISCHRYDIDVKYDEFADASFESKLQTVLQGWGQGLMSDDMAIEFLHKNSSDEIKQRELDFIKANRAKEEEMAKGGAAGMTPDMLGDIGAELGGMNDDDALLEASNE